MKRILLFLTSIVVLVSCSDSLLDPKPPSELNEDDLWLHAAYGEGLLGRAYMALNTNYDINYSYYTDDAVPSTAGINDIALGNWTVEDNPIGQWNTYYESIRYLNQFLDNAYDLTYQVGFATQDSIARSHRIGEAYYLRAWYHWKLLQNYGGYVEGESEAKGIPLVTEVITDEQDALSRSRPSYEESVAQIVTDIDSAITRLPLMYDGSEGTPELYGLANRGRGSELAARALKAKVYLYAASPAYGESTQQLWERAAQAAYEAIDASGRLTQLAPYGNFNDFSNFDNIWIQPTFSSNFLEQQFYPPSLFGSGQANPSQNLIEAFPTADGYPTDHSSSQYDEDNPYKNRDPRFERFVFFNGDNYNGNLIETYEGGDDAPGGLTQQGTRTGYYLKKHLSNNVQLNPGNQTSDIKFKVYLGRAELYLNFAEAANEAFGPVNTTYGFSAADAMRMIRERAGIDSDEGTGGYQDQYLDNQAAAGKNAFRDFIRNERRLELSFEGQRFWDLRRWNSPLTHTVRGVQIASDVGQGARKNVALESATSTDFVSSWETLEAINDDFEPQSSGDNTNGKYGNWNSSGEWRYVQYDFPDFLSSEGISNVFSVDSAAVYWFTDGGGILLPDSTYIQYLDEDTDTWVEVPNWSGYGTAGDQWNVTTFDPVETTSIRLYMKSNTQSTGVIEWQVWGQSVNTLTFNYETVEVETHNYQEYMRYIPLPYNETLIMNNLKQNRGWQ